MTIGAAAALDRLLKLDRTLTDVLKAEISDALDKRNDTIHLGLSARPPRAESLSAAAAFVRGLATLLRPTELSWGDHAGLAEQLVTDELDAVRVRVQVSLAEARRRFADLPDVGVHSALLERAIGRIREADDWEIVPIDCPVCGYPAEGNGYIVDEGDVDVDWNPDGTLYHYAADFFTIVDRLDCSTCGLRLNGTDELHAAGVTSLRVHNERANESPEFHEYFFEPDD